MEKKPSFAPRFFFGLAFARLLLAAHVQRKKTPPALSPPHTPPPSPVPARGCLSPRLTDAADKASGLGRANHPLCNTHRVLRGAAGNVLHAVVLHELSVAAQGRGQRARRQGGGRAKPGLHVFLRLFSLPLCFYAYRVAALAKKVQAVDTVVDAVVDVQPTEVKPREEQL